MVAAVQHRNSVAVDAPAAAAGDLEEAVLEQPREVVLELGLEQVAEQAAEPAASGDVVLEVAEIAASRQSEIRMLLNLG